METLYADQQRINGHGANRLLVYTFLASLGVSAFLAALSVVHVTDLPTWPPGNPLVCRPWLVGCGSHAAAVRLSILALLIETCWGGAALLFLLATVSSYIPVQYFSTLSADLLARLQADHLTDSERDLMRTYCASYRQAGHLIPYGVVAALSGVLLLGFYASVVVGVVIATVLGLVLGTMPALRAQALGNLSAQFRARF